MNPPLEDKLKVLFVEDEVDHAHLVQTFFAGMPEFAVTHAQDGDHALRLLAEGGWDLLVADLNLPGADGFQVIRGAKKASRRSTTGTRPSAPAPTRSWSSRWTETTSSPGSVPWWAPGRTGAERARIPDRSQGRCWW